MNIKEVAGSISFNKKDLKEGEKARIKNLKQTIARAEGLAECSCGRFAYLNDRMECLHCQKKNYKNGPLLWKPQTLEKELRELEDTQSKMQEILGKL